MNEYSTIIQRAEEIERAYCVMAKDCTFPDRWFPCFEELLAYAKWEKAYCKRYEARVDELNKEVQELEKSWRCFQCGKLFLDEKEAADHFGTELNPRHSACKEVYLAMCDELEKAGIKSGFHNATSIVKLANQRDALQRRIDEGAEGLFVHLNLLACNPPIHNMDVRLSSLPEWLKKARKVLILPVEENIKATALNPEATITIKVLPAEETV